MLVRERRASPRDLGSALVVRWARGRVGTRGEGVSKGVGKEGAGDEGGSKGGKQVRVRIDRRGLDGQ